MFWYIMIPMLLLLFVLGAIKIAMIKKLSSIDGLNGTHMEDHTREDSEVIIGCLGSN